MSIYIPNLVALAFDFSISFSFKFIIFTFELPSFVFSIILVSGKGAFVSIPTLGTFFPLISIFPLLLPVGAVIFTLPPSISFSVFVKFEVLTLVLAEILELPGTALAERLAYSFYSPSFLVKTPTPFLETILIVP